MTQNQNDQQNPQHPAPKKDYGHPNHPKEQPIKPKKGEDDQEG